MIEASQIRAGRALLGWSQRQLAEAAGVGEATVKRLEANGTGGAIGSTVAAIEAALESAGVRFLPANGSGPGVRLAAPGAPPRSTGGTA